MRLVQYLKPSPSRSAAETLRLGRPTFLLLVLTLATICSTLEAQQFRAAWADVFHVGMGSTTEVNNLVSTLVAGRYNAVIVQVVGYMDSSSSASHGAQYKSTILPWSTRVTSSFDPLSYLCTQAHASGIQVHAWLGGSGLAMYRVSTTWPPAGNSTLANNPQWMMVPQANSEGGAVVAYADGCGLDMGSPDAQEYIVSIVKELVTNYQIDGINWDEEINGSEYTAGMGFPAYSQAIYPRSGLARYRTMTGTSTNVTPSATDATYGNYRRRFKNELMARCKAEIQAIKSNPRQPLRYTAAVMAYSPVPSSCDFTTSTAYTYYSDWATMLQQGWLDAAIPMAYSSSTYNSWCDRCICWRYNRHIYMGVGAYLQTDSTILSDFQYAYNTDAYNGAVTYSYAVANNSSPYNGDFWSYISTNFYTAAATVPTMTWRNPATATEGTMWGRVYDAKTAAYVDNATVTVAGGPTVQTDGNGYYVATLITATSAGTVHSTTASKTGALSQTITNATVLAGDIVRYDFILNLTPLAPSGLTATTLSSSQIALAWTNNATNATGNVVSRSLVSGNSYTDIASLGPITTNYTDAGLAQGTPYYYVVRATNSTGASPNSAQASATTATPPGISNPPQSLSVPQGSNATFTVTATGTLPLAYQWIFNATNINFATNSSYTRFSAQAGDAGSYSVKVSNLGGNTNSSPAILNVLPPAPTISQDPQSRAAVPGGSALFSVAASGSNPVYQWQLNQTNLLGATSTLLTLSNIQQSAFGPYRAIVTNSGGAATSAVAHLTFAVSPGIVGSSLQAGTFSLQFMSEVGPSYGLEFKQSFSDAAWLELTRTNGTGSLITVSDTSATNDSGFYRLELR